jgi:TRAP-type mannitol/chloroaromatic compound transport system substrate-binding protein
VAQRRSQPVQHPIYFLRVFKPHHWRYWKWIVAQLFKNAGIVGVLAAGAAPAVHAQAASIRWRLASSFPKALDTIFGAAETFAKKVGEMSGGKFVIIVHAPVAN